MNKVGQNHGKRTMSKGLSCYTRSDSGSWSCLVGVIEVNTTRKQLKIHFLGFSHGYDEWRDYDNERNYFPFVRWKKMFFPAEGPLEDRGNIFHGRLYISLHQEKVVGHMYSVLMKLSDLSEFCHFKGIDEISAWRAF